MHILFVCTGNICRSPMAEGIARDRYSDRATFASSGTLAMRGSTPTGSATIAAREVGVDISSLRATSLLKTTDPLPDRIYVMTARHLADVTKALPGLADRVELLDPDGDIADPYGHDLETYRATRDQIMSAIERRASEWGEPTQSENR